MNVVWKDIIQPAALRIAEQKNLTALPPEAALAWNLLPSEMQTELESFMVSKRHENQQCQFLSTALDQVLSAELFVREREEHLVRPLCVLLGYVTSAIPDFLNADCFDPSLLVYEGNFTFMNAIC